MNAVKTLLIRSQDRIIGSSHNFRVPIAPLNDVSRVKLLSASLPNTLYNITAENNTIFWSRGGVNYSATLQPGAYSISAVIGALSTAMVAVDPGAVYNALYSPTFMKTTITCDQAIILRCTITANAIWREIGFSTASDTPALTSHTGDLIVRLDFPPFLLIRIDEIRPLALTTSTGFHANFAIGMSGNSQYVEIFNANSAFENQSLPMSLREGISLLTISLHKPDGSAADLNGADWSAVFSLCYDYSG